METTVTSNDNDNDEDIIDVDEAADRLASALRRSNADQTTVASVLSRVRRIALPPQTAEELRAESAVLDALAAQRSVALFRTEARLHRLESSRTEKVLARLERAEMASDPDWRRSVVDPVVEELTSHEEGARLAEETADAKEDEFVRLRREAHSAVAGLMKEEKIRYREEYRAALAHDGGKGRAAADRVCEIIDGFEEGARAAGGEEPRQPLHPTHGAGSSEYLSWLREEAQAAINTDPPSSFVSFVGELAERCGGTPSIAPLKGYERTVQKAQDKYGGDFSHILDLARGMVVFRTIEDLAEALVVIAEHNEDGRLKVLRAKDRLSQRYDAGENSGGYRDVLLNLCFCSGVDGGGNGASASNLVIELQLNIDSFLNIKNGRGHINYEAARSIHMFNKAFTTRGFYWGADDEDGTCKEAIDDMLKDVREGVVTSLSLDYSPGLGDAGAQQRLAEALLDKRCAVRSLSLRSCRCGDNFLKLCLPEDDEELWSQAVDDAFTSCVRLGSLLHEGTAGRISRDGMDLLLRYLDGCIRILDLGGCLDLDGYENCGDMVVEAIAAHIERMAKAGRHIALPQLQELNLKSTGLTADGAKLLASMRESGCLGQLKVVYMDDDLEKPPARVGPFRRTAVRKNTGSLFLKSSSLTDSQTNLM